MQHAIKKLYYSITEVAKIIGEEQHVLRYWEREFVQLRPQKNRAGNRIYSGRDLAILRVIRGLLREERYTIAGAKEFLKQQGLPEDLEMRREDGDTTVHTVEAIFAPTVSTEVQDGATSLDVVRELRSIAADLRVHAATL